MSRFLGVTDACANSVYQLGHLSVRPGTEAIVHVAVSAIALYIHTKYFLLNQAINNYALQSSSVYSLCRMTTFIVIVVLL